MMKKSFLFLFTFIVLLFIAGCGVKDTVYTSANKEKILQDVGQSSMSQEEKGLFAQALLREAFGGYKLDGKKIGTIVDEQKKFNFEKAKKEAEEKAAKEKLEKELAGYLTVGVESKESHPKDIYAGIYSPYVTMKVLVVNNSQKNIRGYKGYFTVKNIFNETIMKSGYHNDDGIKAAEKTSINLSKDINQFMDEDKKLYNTELSKLKFEWTTTAIIFDDGSSIGVKENKL